MTSENELKDAAYRVRRCEAGETLLVVYDAESWPLAKIAYRDDCERLAIAYLARLAADEQREREDAEPITEEWLVSARDRFTKPGWHEFVFDIHEWRTFVRVRLTVDNGWFVLVEQDDEDGEPNDKLACGFYETRGQLRKLLEALKGGT